MYGLCPVFSFFALLIRITPLNTQAKMARAQGASGIGRYPCYVAARTVMLVSAVRCVLLAWLMPFGTLSLSILLL
jgi:hypothetical protein